MEITAKSLVLDLLAYVRSGDMPVSALVEAGEFFGLAPNNVRVNVSNLFAAGRILRDDRGYYRLARGEAARFERGARWVELEAERVPWPGAWIAVHSPRLGRGSSRARRERALRALGLRELETGLHVRPDNRRGGLEGLRAELLARLDPADEVPLVYGVHGFDGATQERACRLWDSEDLAGRHDELRRRLERSRSRLERMPEREACREGLLLGGEAARRLARDPMLPDEISNPEPRRALLSELRAYERVTRRVWQPLMRRHGLVPSEGGRNARLHAGMAS